MSGGYHLKKTLVFLFLFLIVLGSICSSALPIKNRIRITGVHFEEETVKVEEPLVITVNVTKQRFSAFNGEVHVYLTYMGVLGEEIGENTSFRMPIRKQESFPVQVICNINDIEADWYQETYGLEIVLYEKVLGYLVRKDAYSIESIRVVSKFWEKDKLRISKFQPPDTWYSNKNQLSLPLPKSETAAAKQGKIQVVITNQAFYDYNITVVIYLIEKASMNIPFIEGFGEYQKELGRKNASIPAGAMNFPLNVTCQIRPADIDQINKERSFDVQAVLLAEVDRELFEVDASSIQTLEVKVDDWGEWITINVPWIWLTFIAGIGTFILIIVTIRLILPLTKVGGDEVQKAFKDMRRKKRR